MITDLPHGYETLLDRTFANGQDLSGGQWQRITAARGFYRTADLLIMDEPSSRWTLGPKTPCSRQSATGRAPPPRS